MGTLYYCHFKIASDRRLVVEIRPLSSLKIWGGKNIKIGFTYYLKKILFPKIFIDALKPIKKLVEN